MRQNSDNHPLDKLSEIRMPEQRKQEVLNNLREQMQREEALEGDSRRRRVRRDGWKTAGAGLVAAVAVAAGLFAGMDQNWFGLSGFHMSAGPVTKGAATSATSTAPAESGASSGATEPASSRSGITPSSNMGELGQGPPLIHSPQAVNSETTWAATKLKTARQFVSTSLTTAGASSLRGISFLNSRVGYSADAHSIYKTTDGGQHWQKIYTAQDKILGIDAASPKVVCAYTKTHILEAFDGTRFTPSQAAFTDVQNISVLSNNMVMVLNNGSLIESGGMGNQWLHQSPPGKVLAAAWDTTALGNQTGYAVEANAIYQTRDYGRHWTKVYAPALRQQQVSPWRAQISMNGSHVGVVYYGGDAAMNQAAYIVFTSNDNGKHWSAAYEAGLFGGSSATSGVYGPVQAPNVPSGSMLQPGPIAMLPNGSVEQLGYSNGVVQLLRVSPTGMMNLSNVMKASKGGFTALQLDAVSSQQMVVSNGNSSKPIVAVSMNGGQTWQKP